MPSIRRGMLAAQLAVVATICGGAAVFLPGPPTAQAAVACQSASLAQASSIGSCWAPFSSGSAFTTRLSSNPPLAADNAAVQHHMATYGWTFGYDSPGFTLGGGSRPVFYGSPSDPMLTIHCTSSAGPGTCQGANGVDVNGATIHVPAGAQADDNWDAHLTVVETATGDEYDFWHASISGSTITAGTGAETNVNSGDGTGGGGDAANLALTAGLLRPSELLSGHINHALVIVVPCTDATGAHVGYTWPATGGWGQTCGQGGWSEQADTAPELGQLLRLDMSPSQIAGSGAPVWEQTIMTALADYGAYIEDTGGLAKQMNILTESSSSWTDLGQSNQWATAFRAFGQHGGYLSSDVPIPTGRLELIDTCVTRRTCPDNGNPATNSVIRGSSGHRAGRARLAAAHRAARHRRLRRRSSRAHAGIGRAGVVIRAGRRLRR